MPTPWLDVPLADYEGHMMHPSVGQLEALADLFAQSLNLCRPESIAILGIAGGNGLDRVDGAQTRRILGIDIHPGYLDAVRQRFPKLPLELLQADLQQTQIQAAPVQLVHAALIFEHAGVDTCLQNALSLVAAGGALSVVLQLPSTTAAGVSATPFPAIQNLSGHFQFVDRSALEVALSTHGFTLIHDQHRDLPSGKSFWLGLFRRP